MSDGGKCVAERTHRATQEGGTHKNNMSLVDVEQDAAEVQADVRCDGLGSNVVINELLSAPTRPALSPTQWPTLLP